MKKIINCDNLLIFIPLIILMIISFFCMYQAKFIKGIYLMHLKKQILWYTVGFILIIILQKIKVKALFNYSSYFYWIGNLLLVLVLFLGKEINGARAWFDLRLFNFQPSEFVKISLLFYLIELSMSFRNGDLSEYKFLFKSIIATIIPSLLVFLEPDTGAIIIYLLLLFSVLIFSGIQKKWFVIGFSLLFFIITIFFYLYFFNQDILINLIGTSFFYRTDRLINFQSGSGMQLNNALTTIGNAGILGSGIQESILYVPEFPTDFVFTLSISIFGFIGGIIILLCYFILNSKFINKIFNTHNYQYKLFINGFVFIFIYQQMQNILMNIGLFPIMGIPLPFLSYGGSNMIIYFFFLGIIINITKKTRI